VQVECTGFAGPGTGAIPKEIQRPIKAKGPNPLAPDHDSRFARGRARRRLHRLLLCAGLDHFHNVHPTDSCGRAKAQQ
jgi:hypothetical protein